jgi:hypothetical protein
LFIEWFMQEKLPENVEAAITDANRASVEDALKFIPDALDKFRLFQGHRGRTVNQRREDATIDRIIEDNCRRTKKASRIFKCTKDFKMKWEEQRAKEASAHFYGKRGLSWHVADVACCDYVDGEVVWRHVTLSQTLENENKQDGLTVLSHVEALMKKVDDELPFLKYGIVKTDNATCYHKKELLLAIPLLNAQSKGVKIGRIIHSETQDGKTGVCDGHGATAGRHCKRALKRRGEQTEYNKICTPKELAQALASNGGLRNSGVQLVGTDRSGRLAEIVEIFKSCVEHIADYFARADDITYFPDKGVCSISLSRWLPCMSFISHLAPCPRFARRYKRLV